MYDRDHMAALKAAAWVRAGKPRFDKPVRFVLP
jgi:hypothetical protein